ncbi:LysE family translocator [Streptomyces sp. Ru62]|uniref:LysE family translocator n=1 Tax=Streptomyces sp. Ru62 TaxID=2080745 RepID=UPI000CDD6375|nr:LysE family translocator [Streptomyces sp. Ru62]POX63147.1 LysE family translocator [Streptomyces sp. Ru62]
MVHPYAVLGFLAAVLPLVATPGASLALLVRHVTEGGRHQALPVILGTVTGLYIHATIAIGGLSALVMHSSQAFTIVKVIGAAYLIGLGAWTWRSATAPGRAPARLRLQVRWNSVYAEALFANVLNPKAASIYLTLVPQFIDADHSFDGQILALATVHGLLIALWLLVWSVLVRRVSLTLQRPRFKRAAARITAVVFLALGMRTAAA